MNEIMNIASSSIFAFFILQLINVILSTIKNIIMIKGKKTAASLWNAIYFGYYTFVIKAVTDANFTIFNIPSIVIAAIITIITNIIGVYIGRVIIEKTKKDKLWLVKVSINEIEHDDFVKDLIDNDLPFVRIKTEWHHLKAIDIYLYNKTNSKTLRSIMAKYKTLKYCYMETEMSL